MTYDKKVNFRFSTELLERAKKRAEKKGIDISEYVRAVLADDLDTVILDPNFEKQRSFRVPAHLLSYIEERAKASGMHVQDFIKQILVSSINKEEADDEKK
jgi:predicted DNA binding CopG/RHH family protein